MRVVGRDLIRGGHYGQRSCEPHQKAEHMAAPTNAAKREKSSCQPGAVHTWHETDVPMRSKHVCSASQSMAAKCHVWTAPSWQEFSSRKQHWSVQPCVRPLDAVHMTAGHNALRGSGPDQKHAFDNAVAQVGCPDRRIDRLCITCCSPSQPSHHVGRPTRSVMPQARRVPCNARP